MRSLVEGAGEVGRSGELRLPSLESTPAVRIEQSSEAKIREYRRTCGESLFDIAITHGLACMEEALLFDLASHVKTTFCWSKQTVSVSTHTSRQL